MPMLVLFELDPSSLQYNMIWRSDPLRHVRSGVIHTPCKLTFLCHERQSYRIDIYHVTPGVPLDSLQQHDLVGSISFYLRNIVLSLQQICHFEVILSSKYRELYPHFDPDHDSYYDHRHNHPTDTDDTEFHYNRGSQNKLFAFARTTRNINLPSIPLDYSQPMTLSIAAQIIIPSPLALTLKLGCRNFPPTWVGKWDSTRIRLFRHNDPFHIPIYASTLSFDPNEKPVYLPIVLNLGLLGDSSPRRLAVISDTVFDIEVYYVYPDASEQLVASVSTSLALMYRRLQAVYAGSFASIGIDVITDFCNTFIHLLPPQVLPLLPEQTQPPSASSSSTKTTATTSTTTSLSSTGTNTTTKQTPQQQQQQQQQQTQQPSTQRPHQPLSSLLPLPRLKKPSNTVAYSPSSPSLAKLPQLGHRVQEQIANIFTMAAAAVSSSSITTAAAISTLEESKSAHMSFLSTALQYSLSFQLRRTVSSLQQFGDASFQSDAMSPFHAKNKGLVSSQQSATQPTKSKSQRLSNWTEIPLLFLTMDPPPVQLAVFGWSFTPEFSFHDYISSNFHFDMQFAIDYSLSKSNSSSQPGQQQQQHQWWPHRVPQSASDCSFCHYYDLLALLGSQLGLHLPNVCAKLTAFSVSEEQGQVLLPIFGRTPVIDNFDDQSPQNAADETQIAPDSLDDEDTVNDPSELEHDNDLETNHDVGTSSPPDNQSSEPRVEESQEETPVEDTSVINDNDHVSISDLKNEEEDVNQTEHSEPDAQSDRAPSIDTNSSTPDENSNNSIPNEQSNDDQPHEQPHDDNDDAPTPRDASNLFPQPAAIFHQSDDTITLDESIYDLFPSSSFPMFPPKLPEFINDMLQAYQTSIDAIAAAPALAAGGMFSHDLGSVRYVLDEFIRIALAQQADQEERVISALNEQYNSLAMISPRQLNQSSSSQQSTPLPGTSASNGSESQPNSLQKIPETFDSTQHALDSSTISSTASSLAMQCSRYNVLIIITHHHEFENPELIRQKLSFAPLTPCSCFIFTIYNAKSDTLQHMLDPDLKISTPALFCHAQQAVDAPPNNNAPSSATRIQNTIASPTEPDASSLDSPLKNPYADIDDVNDPHDNNDDNDDDFDDLSDLFEPPASEISSHLFSSQTSATIVDGKQPRNPIDISLEEHQLNTSQQQFPPPLATTTNGLNGLNTNPMKRSQKSKDKRRCIHFMAYNPRVTPPALFLQTMLSALQQDVEEYMRLNDVIPSE